MGNLGELYSNYMELGKLLIDEKVMGKLEDMYFLLPFLFNVGVTKVD